MDRTSQDSGVDVGTGQTLRPQVEDFLDIVLGDPDLLAAEFDAIVARAWGGEVSATEPSTPRGVEGPAPSSSQAEPDAAPDRGPAHPPAPRVRSPPRT